MLETRKRLKEIIDTKTRQIHARDNLIDKQREEIHQWQEENKELYEQGKDLRNENEELKLFKDKVISIMKSKDTIVKKQKEIESYIDTIIKKAKDGEITKDLLKKVGRENYIKNAINWGIGFAISAAFLSTFIPKIQYWITRKVTGSNAFPGTADYSNEKKK